MRLPLPLKYTANRLHAELYWLLDLLLPAHCPLCKRPLGREAPNSHLCSNCLQQCQQKAPSACPRCSEPYIAPNSVDHLCSHCHQDPPPFIWLKTAGLYNEQVTRAIHQFKYQGKTTLAPAIAQCMLDQLREDIIAFAPELVIPVPLHISRLRQRGYNQSLLLGKYLARQLKLPINARGLRRIKPTDSQTQLNAHQRLKNLHNAFICEFHLPPTRVLLVDDVVTTTATARICSNVLTQQGHTVAVIAAGRATRT